MRKEELSIDGERERNERTLDSSLKYFQRHHDGRTCFCDVDKDEESRQFVREEIIRCFTDEKDVCRKYGGMTMMRPYTKELVFVPFVDKEEYDDSDVFEAQSFAMNYCPYCGRKL